MSEDHNGQADPLKRDLVDSWLKRLKSHPLIAGMIIVAVILGGVATFLSNVKSIVEIFGNGHNPDTTQVVQEIRKTFCFVEFNDSALVSEITRLSGWHSVRRDSAIKIIEISYSGAVENIDESNLKRYTGGNVTFLINRIPCTSVTELPLDPTPSFGNPEPAITALLHAKVLELVRQHRGLVAKKISECL